MLRLETKFPMADSWLKENSARPPFAQSFEWEEILLSEKKEVERLAIFDNDVPVALALVEYRRLPFGLRYAFCPKGPVTVSNFQFPVSSFYELLAEYFRKKKCLFFRFEPAENLKSEILNTKYPPASQARALRAGQILNTIDINPRATLILDLKKSPDDLLAQMHPKTRYNIRLAEKHGLRVSDKKDFDSFWKLTKETASRDGFKTHDEAHYRVIFASSISRQLTVYRGEEPLATGLFIGFGETFTYLYGASDYASRALMAPHLIQWEGIKMGQRFGYRFYDFFGVAPRLASGEHDPRHQYAGVTRFKLGFGGEYQESPGAMDLIISPKWYRVYRLSRRVRRLI